MPQHVTDAINELGNRGRMRGYVAETDLLDTGTLVTPEGQARSAVRLRSTHVVLVRGRQVGQRRERVEAFG